MSLTKKLQLLTVLTPDVLQTYKWLETNQNRFKKKVHGPIVLETTFKVGKEEKSEIEKLIQADLFSFVCEEVGDMNTLLRLARDEMKLKINVVHAPKSYDRSFMSEKIEGPEPVLAYLLQNYNFDAMIATNAAQAPPIYEEKVELNAPFFPSPPQLCTPMPNGRVICGYCDKSYVPRALKEHKKNVHGVNLIEAKIKCPLCEKMFTRRSLVTCHIEKDHSKKIEMQSLQFTSFEDFEKWLEEEQKLTTTKYVKERGEKKTNNGSTVSFVCCRQKPQKNVVRIKTIDRKRDLKSQGSIKSVPFCTSFIIVNKLKFPKPTVNVIYYRTHVGHTNDVQFITLRTSEKEAAASDIMLGVKEERILTKAHNAANVNAPSRMDLLTKKDLNNIRASYGLGLLEGRLAANEMQSVDLWVSSERAKSYNKVKYYKRYSDCDIEKNLKEEDFCLVIIAEEQLNMAKKYAHDVVCVDSTHGLGGNDRSIQLSTILVVDEFGEGFPVGFMYCNKIDSSAYKIIFQSLGECCGTIKCNYFMSDMADAIYNAWRDVMGEAKHRLYCSWHVLQAWSKNYGKIKVSKSVSIVRSKLTALLFERDINTFNRRFVEFKEDLAREELEVFAEYWLINYASCVEQWAYCYRTNSPVTNNMHLESMHKVIKYFHFSGREVRRLDDSIKGVMDYISKQMVRLKRRELGLSPWKKAKSVMEGHKKSVDSGLTLLEVTGPDHTIFNEKSGGTYYIKQVKDIACCLPRQQCPECRICNHMFTCSCMDYIINNTICKHIHFVCRMEKTIPIVNNEILSKSIETPSTSHQLMLGKNLDCQIEHLMTDLSDNLGNIGKVPVENKHHVVTILKGANVALKHSYQEAKDNAPPKGKKPKIEKQEPFWKKPKSIQASKKKKNRGVKKTYTNTSTFQSDIEVHSYQPWLDVPVDHEETIS